MAYGTFAAQRVERNPRLDILRKEIEQTVLKPFRSHGWTAVIVREVDRGSYIEIACNKGSISYRILVLYSSSEINNEEILNLQERFDHIFFHGQPYMVDSFARGLLFHLSPWLISFHFLSA